MTSQLGCSCDNTFRILVSLVGMQTEKLATTNAAAFQLPSLTLGYAGYRPQDKFCYGDTFGNATTKYFQDRRVARLNSSAVREPGTSSDGKPEFPTVYSNNPNLVLAARTRTRDRWSAAPKYTLFNTHKRDGEIKDFYKEAQAHRHFYTDKSATVPRVDRFVMPKKTGAQTAQTAKEEDKSNPDKDKELSPLSKEVTLKCPLCGRIAPLDVREYMMRHHTIPKKIDPPKSTWRDRPMRDVYFERR